MDSTKLILVQCPHCGIDIEITQINCGIFRCGVDKYGKQINPHLPKDQCDKLTEIIGCKRPFRYINGKVEKCDYI